MKNSLCCVEVLNNSQGTGLSRASQPGRPCINAFCMEWPISICRTLSPLLTTPHLSSPLLPLSPLLFPLLHSSSFSFPPLPSALSSTCMLISLHDEAISSDDTETLFPFYYVRLAQDVTARQRTLSLLSSPPDPTPSPLPFRLSALLCLCQSLALCHSFSKAIVALMRSLPSICLKSIAVLTAFSGGERGRNEGEKTHVYPLCRTETLQPPQLLPHPTNSNHHTSISLVSEPPPLHCHPCFSPYPTPPSLV